MQAVPDEVSLVQFLLLLEEEVYASCVSLELLEKCWRGEARPELTYDRLFDV